MVDYSQKAYECINRDFSVSEIKKALKSDDDIIKSAAIIKIYEIDTEIAELLIFNLTNQSGPIRELSAYKLCTLIRNYKDYFQKTETLNVIIKSLNDVNPNVVRFILQTLDYFDNKIYIFKSLLQKITELYDEIANKPRRGKAQEHIFTKKCFKIYWSLESIKELIKADKHVLFEDEKINPNFIKILYNLCDIEEYTIREKIAQIVNLLPIKEFYDIKKKLTNDENYFVKRQTGV